MVKLSSACVITRAVRSTSMDLTVGARTNLGMAVNNREWEYRCEC